MSPELDELLCNRYPEIMKDRHEAPNRSAMSSGFECENGWFNIIDQLCYQIQWHISASRARRVRQLRYNRALIRAVRGDIGPLVRQCTYGDSPAATQRAEERVKVILDEGDPQPRDLTEACPKVVATQVKEKMGTLRFYYHGGDDVVRGIVGFAEGMSSVTCEICGNPGEVRGGPWIRTLCDDHDKNDSQAKSS